MATEIKIIDKYLNNERGLMMNETELLSQEARLAVSFIERWGMVAAECDGEDSSGRAKLRLLTTDEVVNRAATIADAAMNEFRRRGWIVTAPTIAEILADEKSAAA